MDKKATLRIFTVILMLYVLFFSLPILVAILYQEYTMISSFVIPAISVLALGIPILLFVKTTQKLVNLKQALMIVPLSWIAVSLVGCIPFMLSGTIRNFSDAFFETVSGLTTTGASILQNIEAIPQSIIFWRALTHWLGGMGIVVLTVATFPLIGIGGNTLIAAESPGPQLEKITSKITHMAKIFWFIYTVLTGTEIILLKFGGMSWFDAITHAFATMATGGFSTKNASIAAFPNHIQIIISIFMFLAGINFSLFFVILSGKILPVFKDTELKMYILVIVISILIITITLTNSTVTTIGQSIIDATFQVLAIITTTGFVSVDFELWPHFAQTVLFILMFFGGCAGSTGGGIKIIRIIVVIKFVVRELIHLFTPQKISHVTINHRSISESYIKGVLLFVVTYILLLLLTTLVVAIDNHDVLTSFTTALATLGNIGPGFGAIGPTNNYVLFSPIIKIFLSLVMIAGRLELFTVLIIFSPRFWK